MYQLAESYAVWEEIDSSSNFSLMLFVRRTSVGYVCHQSLFMASHTEARS